MMVSGSISSVRVVEIVITVFLSFNGSIAAYQSLQLDAGVTAGESQCFSAVFSVRQSACYFQ